MNVKTFDIKDYFLKILFHNYYNKKLNFLLKNLKHHTYKYSVMMLKISFKKLFHFDINQRYKIIYIYII